MDRAFLACSSGSMAVLIVEFSSGGKKLERFLHKNQHTQRKLRIEIFSSWLLALTLFENSTTRITIGGSDDHNAPVSDLSKFTFSYRNVVIVYKRSVLKIVHHAFWWKCVFEKYQRNDRWIIKFSHNSIFENLQTCLKLNVNLNKYKIWHHILCATKCRGRMNI